MDPDEKYGNELKSVYAGMGGRPTEKTPQPMWASSLRECQRFLSDRDFAYVGIFVNPEIGTPSWVACIKAVHQYRAGIPIFLLYDNPPKMPPDQLKQLGIQGYVKTPVGYIGLLKIIRGETPVPIALGPGGEPIMAAPPAPPQPKGIAFRDSDVVAIDLKNRVGSTTSVFDVFIKISNGRYVQIFKSGDKLTQDRLDKYREHGADNLFIPKTQQEVYLNFCDKLLTDFLKDPSVTISQKTQEITRFGAETVDFLTAVGFGSTTMARAQKYVENVTATIGQISLGSPEIKDWMENVTAYEHSLGVLTLAGLMLKNIGVIKPETYHAVGVAALLHDIGLFGVPPSMLLEEDVTKMTPEQKMIFHEHPIVGGHLLSKDKSLPAGVAKAVEQHHIRINGRGFPAPKGVTDLSTIAEIIGISEDFCRMMKRAKLDPTFDPIAQIKEIAVRDYSKSLSTGFLRTIQEK